MNNELVNEISNWRGNRILAASDTVINAAVKDAIDALAPGAMNGLQGLSAEEDGVTKTLWQQAVQAAEMVGDLVFPQYSDDAGVPDDAEPISYHDAVRVIAGRVARAILTINGMSDPTGAADDWYLL